MRSVKGLQTVISTVPVIDFRDRLPTAPRKTAPPIDTLAAQMDAAISDMKEARTTEPTFHGNIKENLHVPQKTWKQIFAERESAVQLAGVWDQAIKKVEDRLVNIVLPKKFRNIENVALFVESHLATVKNYNGNNRFKPYLERLIRLLNALQNTH